MFDHLLEASRLDDSNMWSNIGFDEEIGIIEIRNPRLKLVVMASLLGSQDLKDSLITALSVLG